MVLAARQGKCTKNVFTGSTYNNLDCSGSGTQLAPKASGACNNEDVSGVSYMVMCSAAVAGSGSALGGLLLAVAAALITTFSTM